MPQLFHLVPQRRAIIERRPLSDALLALEGTDKAALRTASVQVLRPALEAGRAEIARRLALRPTQGREAAASYACLTDQLLRLIFDFTVERLYPLNNPTSAERISLIAVGGYGRGEMAPQSDIDIAFIFPYKQTGWSEQVVESMLYTLWDLGLKVGHSSRSLDEMVRMAKEDLTIRTAMLESRYVWGDEVLYDEASARFAADVVAGTSRSFITDKLAERDMRHKRMGDSRYVVEPNLKEGKGGLRDLHTLFWIGKYLYRVTTIPELVDKGLLTDGELRQFQKAENFLWAVRCHLHLIAKRPEERLTFDVQREIAERMRYNDRPGRSAVERFMQHYFLNAKMVGNLTALFLAHLDDTHAAKGRGGDHSVLGAEVAQKLCPRLGLTPAETEAVSWLVEHHLLMSATAFKRDLSDFKTVLDFAETVQSPERLRLLLALTVVDIRAVGPGVWNSWKRQLLTDLFESAEEVLRLGHKQRGRADRVRAKQDALEGALGWPKTRFASFARRLPEPYWVAEPDDVLASNARQIEAAGNANLSISATVYPSRGATLVTVYAADHPGLFYRIAGGIHLAGGSIIDARIHTTRDGMALDNFLVQDPLGRPFDDARQLQRIEQAIEEALANRAQLVEKLAARPLSRARAEAFDIAPNILIDNRASNRYTVIEANARDRPALLYDLAFALFEERVTIHSAHIATYGERAVDTFYVTDLTNDKIESVTRLSALEARLLAAASDMRPAIRAA